MHDKASIARTYKVYRDIFKRFLGLDLKNKKL